jgi:hypothetical protein
MKTGNELVAEIKAVKDQQEMLSKLTCDKRKKLTDKDKEVAAMLLRRNEVTLADLENDLEEFMNRATVVSKKTEEVE